MAKQFNPFHSWLGIDERLGVPTHYQLLGVKPNAEDLDGFCKQVERNYKSVKATLDGMSAAEVGSHQKLHARLVSHVDKARKTLLDDQLRKAYLNSLREKVRQKKAANAAATKAAPSKTGSPKPRTETPTLKTEAPTVRKETPTLKTKPPAVRKETPAVRKETPTLKTKPPAVRKETPTLKTKPPAVRKETPAVRAETPTLKTTPKRPSTAAINQKNPQAEIKRTVKTPTNKAAQKPAIPMAIPVAEKVATPVAKPIRQPTRKVDAAPDPQRSEANIVAEIDQLESRARSEAIMIRSLKGKPKKSYLMPILLGSICLLGAAKLYGLLSGSDYKLSMPGTPEEHSVASAEESTPAVTNESAPAYNPAVGETAVANSGNEKIERSAEVAPKTAAVDSSVSLPELPATHEFESAIENADLAMESTTNTATPKTDSDSESILGEMTDDGPMILEPLALDGDAIELLPESDLEMAMTKKDSSESKSSAVNEDPTPKELPAPVFFAKKKSNTTKSPSSNFDTAKFFVTRARSEMKRGRVESAKEQYSLAEELVGNLDGKNGKKVSKAIDDGQNVADILDGFWTQVIKSSRAYDGDSLQPTPGTIIGFVEGREDDVVVKIGGETFAVPYRSLRPGLAMELASKGDVSDMDRWGMQQAAFRIVHSSGSKKSIQAIEDLLSEAETAGVSTDQLRRFWENNSPDASLAAKASEKKSYQPKSLKPLVDKLVAGKYTNIRRMSAEKARSFAMELCSVQHDDVSLRVAALDESIKLATRAGEAGLMLDLVDELGTIADVKAGVTKADCFGSMLKRSPRDVDARGIADACYEFVRSADAKDVRRNQLQKLKTSMLEFATKNRMTDLKRLISQSME